MKCKHEYILKDILIINKKKKQVLLIKTICKNCGKTKLKKIKNIKNMELILSIFNLEKIGECDMNEIYN